MNTKTTKEMISSEEFHQCGGPHDVMSILQRIAEDGILDAFIGFLVSVSHYSTVSFRDEDELGERVAGHGILGKTPDPLVCRGKERVIGEFRFFIMY
jgi:hypothetical protein